MTYVVIFPRVKRETAMQFLIDRVAFRLNFLTVMQHLFGGQSSLEWMSAKVREVKIFRSNGQKNRFDLFLIQVKMQLACEIIRFSSLFAAGKVSRGGTSATQRQKFHTDDANQSLHNKSGSHGVPIMNCQILRVFWSILVKCMAHGLRASRSRIFWALVRCKSLLNFYY